MIDIWNNMNIYLFYDEEYFNNFFYRYAPYQTWTLIESRSFIKSRCLKSELKEKGYVEVINDEDETYKCEIWFYGEL